MKNNKVENLREKLKQALTSTARVISDDIHLKTIDEKNKKDLNVVDIENLNSKGDFIKAMQGIQAGLDEAEYGFNDLQRLKGMSSSDKRIVKTLVSRFKLLVKSVEGARSKIEKQF